MGATANGSVELSADGLDRSPTRASMALQPGPRLRFDHRDHHFGTVLQGKIVRHRFHFRNVGDTPLKIDDVSTPCGCTAVVPNDDVVPPGGESYVDVEYDSAARSGDVTRIITVTSNDAVEPVLELTVTAHVDASQHAGFEAGEALFGDKCGSCHATPAAGLQGSELYAAVCWFCHGTAREGKTAPPLPAYPATAMAYLGQIIAQGRPGTEMPGYATAHGGPLSDAQIASLKTYLAQPPPEVIAETPIEAAAPTLPLVIGDPSRPFFQ